MRDAQVLFSIGSILGAYRKKQVGRLAVTALHGGEPEPLREQTAVKNAEVVGSIEHRDLQCFCGTAAVLSGDGAAAVEQCRLQFFQQGDQLGICFLILPQCPCAVEKGQAVPVQVGKFLLKPAERLF